MTNQKIDCVHGFSECENYPHCESTEGCLEALDKKKDKESEPATFGPVKERIARALYYLSTGSWPSAKWEQTDSHKEYLQRAEFLIGIFQPEPTLKLENQRYWDGVYDAIAAQPLNVSSSKEPEPTLKDEPLTDKPESTQISTCRFWRRKGDYCSQYDMKCKGADYCFGVKDEKPEPASEGELLTDEEILEATQVTMEDGFLTGRQQLCKAQDAKTRRIERAKHQAERQAMVAEIESYQVSDTPQHEPYRGVIVMSKQQWSRLKDKWLGVK